MGSNLNVYSHYYIWCMLWYMYFIYQAYTEVDTCTLVVQMWYQTHSPIEWPHYRWVRCKLSMQLWKLHVITFHLIYKVRCMIIYWVQGMRLKKKCTISENSKVDNCTYNFTFCQKWSKTINLCHICTFWPYFEFTPSKDRETDPLHKKSYLAYI